MRLRYALFLFAAMSGLFLLEGASLAQQAAPGTKNAVPADQVQPDDPNAVDMQGGDDVSVEDIPDVETEELTAERAGKAVDGYVLIQNKYQDSATEDYTDLQEFVDKDAKGGELDKDIKALGFKSVTDWSVAVTSVSVAYNNILEDVTDEIRQKIEAVRAKTDVTQVQKDRALKSLQNSIPSENNTKIVQELMKDKGYTENIKLLESTEE